MIERSVKTSYNKTRMTELVKPPQSVVVMAHPGITDAFDVSRDVASFLNKEGIKTQAGSLYDEELRYAVKAGSFDLLIALGGDGTMLRAGHLCAPVDIPLLGINVGHFGFLVELKHDDWREVLPKLLQGDYRYEERMMMTARCERNGHEDINFDVINDVVVARGQYVRPIEVEACLNGAHIASYVADGLIASTATGSTAYALAVGGPILPPELRNILLIPVAPHLSVDRAIVLSEGSSVCIRVQTNHEAVVSIDGQEPVHLESGDAVHVNAHDKSLHMVRFQDPYYFYRNLTAYMEHNPIIRIKSDE